MPQRRGFTLVEVMIALIIMGIVTGAIYRLLDTNQRLSLAQAEQVSLQSNVRTGSLVVPNELRELNTWLTGLPDQNDIQAPLDDDAITYRAMRGLGFLCQAAAAGATELRLARSNWTGLRAPDDTRDDLYLFTDKDPYDDDDDTWTKLDVTVATPSATACGAGAAGYVLTVAAIPEDMPPNTPVRLFELMELELYAEGGEWWLGARSVNTELNPQPVLGPLTGDGFGLEYLDSNGNPTADHTAIKSIRLTVRGVTDDAVRAGGSAALAHSKAELVTQVLLRNSIRP